VDEGRLTCRASGASPAASVAEALAALPADSTVLVTTADHPLLTTATVEFFLTRAAVDGAAVVAAMVSEKRFRARFPAVRRTFIALRDDGYCGANLFLFRTPEGLTAAEFWRRAEVHRKQPWRLAAVFGVATLAGFALRRFDLADAIRRVSRVIGVSAAVVELEDAESAIDVDSPEDATLVQSILAARAADARP
jgi:GTP:adenosylcobinamide-phosphate guanylyltransferase